jgi:hypothetical protein
MFPIRSWIENIDNFAYFDRGAYSIVLPTGESVFNWNGFDMCLPFKDRYGNNLWANDVVFLKMPLHFSKAEVYVDITTNEQHVGQYAVITYNPVASAFFLKFDSGGSQIFDRWCGHRCFKTGHIYKRS